MNSNILGRAFDWLGDALEHFNPSAFRFLAAVLPYLTPVPVAWLTASSSATFLHFTNTVAFIFVFALEGIGLWFTSLLVDSVVEWIRSRNWRTFAIVLLFTLTVGIYVFLLVSLNVTLETAAGNTNPALSKVITLLCFLPLITGVGNGYYKLRLEHKTDIEKSRIHQEEREDRDKELAYKERMEKYRLKHGFETTNRSSNSTSRTTSGTPKSSVNTSRSTNGSSKMGRPSIHEDRVFSYMDDAVLKTGNVPTFTEIVRDLNLPASTASRLREKWINKK